MGTRLPLPLDRYGGLIGRTRSRPHHVAGPAACYATSARLPLRHLAQGSLRRSGPRPELHRASSRSAREDTQDQPRPMHATHSFRSLALTRYLRPVRRIGGDHRD